MPTYDFTCNHCNQRFDVFLTFSEYGKKAVTCTHCGSQDVRRRMTKVRIAKSEDSRMDSMADDFSGFEGLENDPKAMGQMMRKMGKEMGEEMPAEFDEVVDRLESGQSPEDIEKAIPDLGSETSGGDADDE
ncbi:MAG TPA: zinc ribbon domain-containing protein [Anaerolineales bacterium]|nr:zinc ribbon domain-containing protein [Anaerolineales bacterium]